MKQSEFYAREAIAPFRRDLSNTNKYFEQRRALLEHLGIPARLLKGARILEFGPGHGENALYLLKQEPAELVLVEINEECALAAEELLLPERPESTKLSVLHMDMQDFRASAAFDMVVFEGVIPFEPEPEVLLLRTSEHVAQGGLLCVTTIDSVSLFSEALRRLIGLLAAPVGLTSRERIARLVPIFAPHLNTLAGMTRSHEDWVLDQMIHPWSGRQLSILDAADALGPEFELYGSSPRFLCDWRWFRDIHGEQADGQLAERNYLANLHNLIDYRLQAPQRATAENCYLLEFCNVVLESVRRYEHSASAGLLEQIALDVRRIAQLLASDAPEVTRALEDYLKLLASWQRGVPSQNFGSFSALFGRGQQYVSFLCRTPTGDAR